MSDTSLSEITLLQEVAQDRLDRQLDAIDSLDTKIIALLSMGTGLVVLVAGIAAIDSSKVPTWIALPLIGLVGSFVVLFVTGMIALRAQTWRIGADLSEVAESLGQAGEEVTRRRLAKTIIASIDENVPAYTRKVLLIRPVFLALALEVVASLVALASLVH